MRVIAKQGDAYLIVSDEECRPQEELPRPPGRVFDAQRGTLYAPRNVHSILKFGGWHAFELDDAATRALLAGAAVDGPGLDEPWELPPLGGRRDVKQKAAA